MKTLWGTCFILAGTVASCLVTGCGESSELTLRDSSNPGKRVALRIELRGTDVTPRIASLRRISLVESAQALPSLDGPNAVVAYDEQDRVVAALPFALPKSLIVDGIASVTTLALAESSLALTIPEDGIHRIELLDATGNVLDASEAPPPVDVSNYRLQGEGEGDGSALRTLRADFPEIEFLNASSDLGLRFSLPGTPVEELRDIPERAVPFVRKALMRLSPLALSSVRTLGVARLADAVGVTYGSTVLLGHTIEDTDDAVSTLAHEATHAFAYLVDYRGQLVLNRTTWPDEVVAAARTTIETFSLQRGLTSVWNSLHQDGVEEGVATAYGEFAATGDALDDRAKAPVHGFASTYGSSDASEDLAEWVATVKAQSELGKLAESVCGFVRNAPKPFPPERALPYIKLKLLEALGLIGDQELDACIGSPSIEGPTGIHLGTTLSLTADVKAGFVDSDGHFLAVFADALPYHAGLRVLPHTEQPRGIYRLDDIGIAQIDAPTNAFLLANDSSNLLGRASSRGLVLVSEYDSKSVAGAIFFLALQNGTGMVTDRFPISTFRAPRP